MVEPNDLNTKILCTIKGKQKQINTINTDTNIKSTNTHTLSQANIHTKLATLHALYQIFALNTNVTVRSHESNKIECLDRFYQLVEKLIILRFEFGTW